jgi:hypothetical protein
MSDSNHFHDVKRLLKLKRHEAPPPGYFNHFSGDVISRIRAGEGREAEGFLAKFEGNSFMAGLVQLLHVKPGVLGGFATSLCLLLLIGVVMAERTDDTSTASDITGLKIAPTDTTLGTSPLGLAAVDSSTGITISSNSMVSLQPTVATFSSQPSQNPLFQTVGFKP